MTVHIDNLTAVSADVTYQNGTSQSYNNVVMFQDTAGNLFLVNSDYAGTNLNTNSGIESINVTSVDSGAYNALIQSALQEFICFQSGTRIGTPGGEVAIEALRIGDLVLTADKGPQPILWIGRSNVKETPENAPIKLCAGSLGANLPLSDLYISRQHRILLGSKIAERMFGVSEILAPARTLLDVNGVSRGWNAKPRVYYHILFAGHEVIWANGCRAESLLLGQQAKDLMGREAWAELTTLLPGAARLPKPQPAREIPKPSRVRGLLARHKRNGKPLLAPIA